MSLTQSAIFFSMKETVRMSTTRPFNKLQHKSMKSFYKPGKVIKCCFLMASYFHINHWQLFLHQSWVTRKKLLVQICRGGNRNRYLNLFMEGWATWSRQEWWQWQCWKGRQQGRYWCHQRFGDMARMRGHTLRSVATSEYYIYAKGLLCVKMSSSVKKLTDWPNK